MYLYNFIHTKKRNGIFTCAPTALVSTSVVILSTFWRPCMM